MHIYAPTDRQERLAVEHAQPAVSPPASPPASVLPSAEDVGPSAIANSISKRTEPRPIRKSLALAHHEMTGRTGSMVCMIEEVKRFTSVSLNNGALSKQPAQATANWDARILNAMPASFAVLSR